MTQADQWRFEKWPSIPFGKFQKFLASLGEHQAWMVKWTSYLPSKSDIKTIVGKRTDLNAGPVITNANDGDFCLLKKRNQFCHSASVSSRHSINLVHDQEDVFKWIFRFKRDLASSHGLIIKKILNCVLAVI